MPSLSEHDQRQLTRMAERLRMAQENELSLRVLISDLEFLLEALESSEIAKQIRKNWEVLEEVYAVSLEHDGQLDAQDRELVNHAMEELRAYVDQHLESMGSKPSA